MKEVDVGRSVVKHFEACGWDVYQEVSFGGRCADIVLTRAGEARPTVAVVECKTALTFDLMAQVWEWRKSADALWVAVPMARRTEGRQFAHAVLKHYGIGLIEVNFHDAERLPALVRHNAGTCSRDERSETLITKLLGTLRQEHKTHAPAGTNAGGRFSEYHATCANLRTLVAAEPGIELAAAIARIEHHYSNKRSAVGALRKWIANGRVPGIRFEPNDTRPRLFLTDHERKTT